jgi:hypothetical protein
VSVYDEVAIGPLRMVPRMINSDYVWVELLVPDDSPKPDIEDGALHIPVKVWEQVQGATHGMV